MSERQCVFCKAQADSREHVMPVWLTKDPRYREIVQPTMYTAPIDTPYVIHDFEQAAKQRGAMPNRGITCRYVCGTCNNGWMSALESRMRSIVEKCGWGKSYIDLKPYAHTINWWLMLRLTAINAFWGGECNYGNSFPLRVMNGDIDIDYADYFVGADDSIRMSLASPLPDPSATKEQRIDICKGSIVISAQIGRLFLRSLRTSIISGAEVLVGDPGVTNLGSRIPYRRFQTRAEFPRSTEQAFSVYSSTLIIAASQ